MPPSTDLVVCRRRCAVNSRGVRIGEGSGYSDLELALLVEKRACRGAHTTIATTVHPLQLVSEELPETAHDFRVDLIVTSDEVDPHAGGNWPSGILWDHLEGREDRRDPDPEGARMTSFTTRPELRGTFGMVASTHWLASATGWPCSNAAVTPSTPLSPPASRSRWSNRT